MPSVKSYTGPVYAPLELLITLLKLENYPGWAIIDVI